MITKIRSNLGGEFGNECFKKFCAENGMACEFSTPRTLQQNGIVDRSLEEMTRTMLHTHSFPNIVGPKLLTRHAIQKIMYILAKWN